MRILFATAELCPMVRVGGLGEASAGLVDALRRAGHEVEVVLPDYEHWSLDDEEVVALDLPEWARPATARRGAHAEAGWVTLVDAPGVARSHPYVDPTGVGWPDNDRRFGAFSAAVASLAATSPVDVVHLNDWHTGLVPALLGGGVKPTVLTIHNLAHQGWADLGWRGVLPHFPDDYVHSGAVNMLAGAIRTADAVVAVSPTYATEILSAEHGMGLSEVLAARRPAVTGIRNGIDTRYWNPEVDDLIPCQYDSDDLFGKEQARKALHRALDWDDDGLPVVAMVSRLVDQKGIDLAFEAARFLPGMRARLAVLGSGEPQLADAGRRLAEAMPDTVWFSHDFEISMAHLLIAGADLFLMPSRFEPCGLAQMQAMAYGTIPVVTGVGGLLDTVIDADTHRDGTGFVSDSVDVVGVVDALHRATKAWRHGRRRGGLIGRAMSIDWSWDGPAQEFCSVYESVCGGAGR